MEKIWVYPGSFDPVTLGHLDIIRRASKMCDRLVVAVMVNSAKKNIFTMEERTEMLRKVTANLDNVEIRQFSGLLVDFAKEEHAAAIVRGLRAVSDYEIELQMAHLNKELNDEVETLFMMTAVDYSFLSSSIVREIASYGGDISALVPENIRDQIIKKFTGKFSQPK